MTNSTLEERRTRVFVVLSGFFMASMALLNVIGLTRFIELGPLSLAVGVLPYPLTFLITDLISELYGKERANFIVLLGLSVNVFVFLLLALGLRLPGVPLEAQPPWQILDLANEVALPNGQTVVGPTDLFTLIYACASGSIVASMFSYMAAQAIDVQIFHAIKERTGNKHLWLRNNGSTLISQAVDSIVVIGVTFGAMVARGDMPLSVFFGLLASNYGFKMAAALLDTLPFYWLASRLKNYLHFS